MVDPVDPPANLTFGTVVLQGVGGTTDSSDGDTHPDLNALTGTVTFRLNVVRLIDATASPNPISIANETVTGTIGPDGFLGVQVGAEWQAGVELIANDNPALNPTSTSWTVDYSGLKFATTNRPVGWPTQSIYVVGGETIDLSLDADVPAAPPLGIAASEANAAIAVQAALDAEAAAEAAEAALAGAVTEVNGEHGVVTISLVLDGDGFYDLEVAS